MKLITLKFRSKCRDCGRTLASGMQAKWAPGRVTCVECPKTAVNGPGAASTPPSTPAEPKSLPQAATEAPAGTPAALVSLSGPGFRGELKVLLEKEWAADAAGRAALF